MANIMPDPITEETIRERMTLAKDVKFGES